MARNPFSNSSRCSLSARATFFIGSRRERIVRLHQRSRNCPAQYGERNLHAFQHSKQRVRAESTGLTLIAPHRFCRRPLFIMTDQQRGDCLGIEGHPVLQTPYLDHVAASGIRFSRAYSACPVCTPARRGRRHVRSLLGLLSVDCAGTILDDQPGR